MPYLKDTWCQLDFVVVSLAWLPILFPNFGNFSVVRSVRALRPLRALKRMPGMPVLVNSILGALPEMSSVVLLCGLFISIFGVLGVELFKGTLHYRCAAPGFVETEGHPLLDYDPVEDRGRVFAQDSLQLNATDQKKFDSNRFCNPHLEAMASQCTAQFPVCAYFDANINGGVTTYDSISYAFIAILQTLTFDGWTSPMYALLNTTSDPFVIFYSLFIVFVGGFFIVNMFLAVLFTEFMEAQAIEKTAQILAVWRDAIEPFFPSCPCLVVSDMMISLRCYRSGACARSQGEEEEKGRREEAQEARAQKQTRLPETNKLS